MTANLERHVAAFAADPGDTHAFGILEEGYFFAGDWDSLVALYRQRLAAPDLQDPHERAGLHYRLGQILEERCLDLDLAIEQYTQAVRLDSRFHPALRQLRLAHARREAWDLVLQIAELEIETLHEPYERATFFAEMGDVWLRHLGDSNEALTCFQQALAIDPEHKDALAGLARALEAQDNPEAAAATWERLIGCVRGPDRALPLVSLANLLSGPLHQGERAIELYRRALGDDPRNETAVEALSIAAAARGQWELLADLYERRFGLAAGARRRTAIALEAGYTHLEQLGNVEAARIWFERAREMSGDDETVLAAWVELEREAGDTEALAGALDRLIDAYGPRTPLHLLLEAAGVHTERADDERALRVLELAEGQASEDPLVLEMLGATYGNLQRHDECAAILERRAALHEDDPDTRAGILIELGYVQATQLGDIPAAQDAYERAFAVHPEHPGLASTLEALYRKTESVEPLRRLLERAAEHGPESERAAFACALGELLESQLGDLEASRVWYEASLDRGASPRALQGLSRLAVRSGDPEAMHRALEREAAVVTDPERLAVVCLDLCDRCESAGDLDAALGWAERLLGLQPDSRPGLEALARIQQALDRQDDLTRTLERLEELLEGTERGAVRRRIALLHEESGDSETALVWWESTLESDPDDLDALAALERHYRTQGLWEELAKVLRRLGERAPEAERPGHLDALARVLDEQLADLDAAIVVLWRLADAPGRPADASERLENLLERAGRFEELAQQLLERRRGLPDDAAEALDLELRRAQLLLDPLGQYEQAARAFKAVRLRAPDRPEAIEGLEHALRASNDVPALARLLEEMATASEEPGPRAELLFERAVLLEESLGELEQARQAYASLCGETGAPQIVAQAGDRLESLLERCGDWTALRGRLEEAVARAAEPERVALHERIARLCLDRMHEPEDAAAHLEEAVRIDPQRPDPWRLLGSVYHELQRDDDLLRAIGGELETRPDPERERVLHARAAELWSRRPGGEDDASAHYERLLELDPGRSDATEYLVERYESQGRHDDVVLLLEERLAAVEAADEAASEGLKTSLRLRIATLRVEELDDREGAIALLEKALEADGPCGPAAEPLADLYRETGRFPETVVLCEDAARESADPDERLLWLRRLGGALRETGESERAIEVWREVLAEHPEDERAYAALCDTYRTTGDAESLARLLEEGLPRRSGAVRVGVRMELARLLEQELDRPADALEHLVAVLGQESDHEAAFHHALSLAHRLQRHDHEMALVEARLERPVSHAERVDLLERRADLLAGPLEAPEAAVAAYREVMSLAPDRSSARRSLRHTLEGLGRWAAVLDCLYVEAESASPAEQAAIFEQAAEIAAAQVGQDAALPWLERLRAVRPDDPLILARIADVHRLAGRFESVLRAIEDELRITRDPTHARDLHVGRARILERDLAAPGRAIGALQAARALAPEDPDILAQLDALYAETGRPRERAEVVEARLELCPPDGRLPLHLTAAELYAGPLAEPDSAVPHLLHAVSLTGALDGGGGPEPSTPEARIALLSDLASTLRSAGRIQAWSRAAGAELRAVLHDLAERPAGADDPRVARRNVLHRELAWAHGDRLANPAAALHHLRVLMADAEAGEVAGLDADDLDQAERRLIDLLRRDANWVELEQRLSARVARGSDTAEEWLELARLRDERLHAPRAARDAYARSAALRADSLPAIRGLRDLSERLADWPELARALELERAHPDSAPARRRTALSRRLGEVAWHHLADPARAIEAFEDALAADGDDLVAMRALQQLCEAQQDWERAADLYEREARCLGDTDPERRRSVWLAAAALYDRRTEDPQRALHAYEEAAALGALDLAPLRAQAELYRRLGDLESFATTWASWCDDGRSRAAAADHLLLVETLLDLGRPDDAVARCHRAIEADGTSADAWARLAGLLQDQGQTAPAADAWEEAGERRRGPRAAEHLRDAALLVESSDPMCCARRLRRAIERDPAAADAHAHLARLACRLERFEEAETAATRALDLSAAESPALAQTLERDTAIAGGRAARALGRLDSAVRFYTAALEREPDDLEALEACGELLFERGDLAAARSALEARIALGPDARHAERLAMLGSVLELTGEPDEAALERFRQAASHDAACGAGHAGVARLCEKAGRIDEAVEALDAWAAACREHGDRAGAATRHLRAAELELARDGDDAARLQLHACLAADPHNARAWVLLVETLAESDRCDEILRRVPEALCLDEVAAVPDAVGRLSLLYARALERRGDPTTACEAYGAALANDPRCAEAALARARLLRGMGAWQEAADCLRGFCDGHPEPEHRDLAEVHYKLARLLSGPLEDMDGAIRCFERALQIAPDHARAREPLASLLSVMPDRWRQAVRQHVALLQDEPSRTGSIRALVRLARERQDEEGARFGLALLRAIGAASPSEQGEAPRCLPAPIAPVPELEEPGEELVRQLVQQAAEALAQVLPPSSPVAEGAEDFVSRRDRALAELAAPGLDRLSDDELGELLAALVAMALGDEAAGPSEGGSLDPELARGLDRALGRWTKRKLRRLLEGSSLSAVQTIDAEHWRVALRGLAAAVAVDLAQGDLRQALLQLCGIESETSCDSDDLSVRLQGAPEAKELLRRAAAGWCRELLRG